jgi:hypothetical protein
MAIVETVVYQKKNKSTRSLYCHKVTPLEKLPNETHKHSKLTVAQRKELYKTITFIRKQTHSKFVVLRLEE